MSQQTATVGQRINYVRTQQKLSLEQLARRTGLSKSFLWEVERDRSGISASRLLQVADALGASVEYLLRGGSTPEIEEARTLEIPPGLSELAEELGLTFRQTRILLDVDRSIVARRGGGTSGRKHKGAWRSLYEAVNPFIEDIQ